MVFSSVVFLFYFFPLFIASYALLWPLRPLVIVVGSLIFYGWGDPSSIGLLIAFILFNWLAGMAIARATDRRQLWLAFGCIGNLLVLITYKYAGFLVDQVSGFATALGAAPIHVVPFALPLGISFFTFQGISYLIDVSRGVVRAQPSLLKFAMYKAMFPQLIAGPIVRYSQIVREIDDRTLDADRMVQGVQVFAIGMAQKVLVANTVAVAADQIFALPNDELTAATAWFGAVCYMVQIYFDFGGYSNMAIGLGKMIGFSLPQNFANPYSSASMTEFWRRWHISLSTWFRDYLYIPLGGNRRGRARTYCNLLITFFLCGLWHGAAWTFAVWGLYHGMFLIIERVCSGVALPRVFWPARHAYVLLAVLVGWVFFRSRSLDYAWHMLLTMAGVRSAGPVSWPIERFATNSVLTALIAATAIVAAPALRITRRLTVRPANGLAGAWDGAVVLSTLVLFTLSALAISSGTYNPFIYFRF